jgi:hypothetical protein
MAYTETTTTGYGTRVGNSFKAIGTGFLMFLAGTALLWWNEGRAVKTEDTLNEVLQNYVEMTNPEKKDASLEGELICGTAMATTEDSLSDDQFGIGAKAISIRRTVKYYQWVENVKETKKDKLGGSEEVTKEYTYKKEWVSRPVESSDFKNPAYQKKNMVLTTVEKDEKYAENVSFGAYKLSESLIHCISSREAMELAISEDLLKQIDKSTQTDYERFYGVQQKNQQPVEQPAVTAEVSDSAKAANDSINNAMANAENKKDLEYIHQAGNVLYYGRVPGSPEVGDVCVTFEKVVPAKVTVIAVVDGDTFKKYKAKNNDRYERLVMGKKSADEIIDSDKATNSFWTWALRFIGALIVIGGLKGIFGFIEMILKVVPFIAGIFGWGVGLVCTVVGVVWSLIVIALAWLFYRPLLGIALLVLAGFLIWVFAFKGKDKLKELAAKAGQPKAQPETV